MLRPVCSVVIPSYRASGTIARCLSALLCQDFALPYEIIVVDSSPDQTPDLVRREFPTVHLIHLRQQTDPAAARNIGAEYAQAEMLAFIDADCVAPSDWLSRLYAALQAGYDAVGGAIANGNGDSLVSWAGYFCEFRDFLPGGPAHDATNLTLGNAVYRRVVLQAVGGFPAGYFPQEDQIFHACLCREGCRIRLEPRIVVTHFHRTKWREFMHHQRRIGRVNALVVRQLRLPGASLTDSPWRARMVLPLLVPFRFLRTVAACWRVERSLVLRQPILAALCLLGMVSWGQGFVDGAG
jgi:glycosyltransferase involved in cell wall biosynthesis